MFVDHADLDVPRRRALQVFAFDPLLQRRARRKMTIDVPYEPLGPLFLGERLRVIDYDGAAGCFWALANLDDPKVAMQAGYAPDESDPRFHQQMVYAVASRVIETFDRALGRRFRFKGARPLLLMPHAFRGSNAFFDPRREAVLFGYFRAPDDARAVIPGQNVFACLSHDIIAHELTHAITHRMRPYFQYATNPDVAAFHEGFADIIAVLHHFTFEDITREVIRERRGDLASASLADLAAEFGEAAGIGPALRSAVEAGAPRRLGAELEPHDRGAVLLAAVFDGFLKTFQARVQGLVRAVTAGTSRLPEGELQPDLVGLFARECSDTARQVLTMCARAMDYLPPVDVTFGDFLVALVCADFDLYPEDGDGLRASLIEAFRVRGIFPEGAHSLSERALLFGRRAPGQAALSLGTEVMRSAVARELFPELQAFAARQRVAQVTDGEDEDGVPSDGERRSLWADLAAFAEANRAALHLSPDAGLKVRVLGCHAMYRTGSDGRPRSDFVIQFVQEVKRAGSPTLYGGTTIIADLTGKVRYLTSKPLDDEARGQRERALDRWSAWWDEDDERSVWRGDRDAMRINLRALHAGRGR